MHLVLFHAAYTYFYKDTKYWRFDNRRMKVDSGYPRSILNDFMGCRVHFEAEPEVKPDHRRPDATDKDPDDYKNDEDEDEKSEEENEEIDVVLRVNNTNEHVMTLILVIVPLVLVLCILGVIYVIITTLQKKETPKVFVHCKRSLQQWV